MSYEWTCFIFKASKYKIGILHAERKYIDLFTKDDKTQKALCWEGWMPTRSLCYLTKQQKSLGFWLNTKKWIVEWEQHKLKLMDIEVECGGGEVKGNDNVTWSAGSRNGINVVFTEWTTECHILQATKPTLKKTLTKSMRENVYANIYCVSFPLFHSLIQNVKEHAKRNMLGNMSSSVYSKKEIGRGRLFFSENLIH